MRFRLTHDKIILEQPPNMQRKDGSLLYSPSDLIVFMSDPFSSWMDRCYLENPDGLVPDNPDESAALVQKHGILHEQEFLHQLKADGADVCIIESKVENELQQTVQAMKQGREVIYQGYLRKENFAGLSDFLIRTSAPSQLGPFSYEVWDSKLAKKPKPYFLVQLCCYAEMLELVQGCLPKEVAVVLGNKSIKKFRLQDYYYYYKSLKQRFLEFQANFLASTPPEWTQIGDYSRWSTVAERLLDERDDLIRVANIRKSQIRKLKEEGINTMAALSETERLSMPGISQQSFETLKAQAKLQCKSQGLDKPLFEIIQKAHSNTDPKGLSALPPASELDVFFDMEGYPHMEVGLEYLFGVSYLVSSDLQFKDWWAHDRLQEKRAFEEFLDWISERKQNDPEMHVYHYGAYEVSALRRLASRHATRESQLDQLLRAEVFVDLYAVVKQGIRIGCDSYSIKKVELLYMGKRQGEVAKATDSIVYYERWLEHCDGNDWQESAILRQIREYNRFDCDSTARLCQWLRERQKEHGIKYETRKTAPAISEKREQSDNETLAELLFKSIPLDRSADPEKWRIVELFSHLLCFHKRESKVSWWEIFDRAGLSDEELFADPNCIAFVQRTPTPPEANKKSYLFEYSFDPDQDIKLTVGDTVVFSHDIGVKAEICDLSEDSGLLVLRRMEEPPNVGHLILQDTVNNAPLEKAILLQSQKLLSGATLNRCLDDLLHRNLPRVKGKIAGEPLCSEQPGFDANELLDERINVIRQMDNSYICIQGPPGTGKTYLAAKAIVRLIKDGKKIGVSSNSHKAIEKLLEQIGIAALEDGLHFNGAKIKLDKSGVLPKFSNSCIKLCTENKVVKALDDYHLIGATAWFFAKTGMAGKLDYLFVDEAGQVCLANIVAMAESAKNLVLVGDQLQLDQPVKGSHPGESGCSSLEYLLQEAATITAERGIFLANTRRMHPDLCSIVSSAVYDGRLHSDELTIQRNLLRPPNAKFLAADTGVIYVPIEHSGNSQSSLEELECIREIVDELLRCKIHRNGEATDFVLKTDLLIVAPYNKQVRLINSRLTGVVAGTVDKFQGSEAAVVIVSMCASDLASSTRGLEFLLSKKRLNVAISRAQLLAIIVGSPALSQFACANVEQAELLNLYCRIMQEGSKSKMDLTAGGISC